MNAQIVSSLVRKDVLLFFRNQFFALVTVLGLVFYALIYFLLPAGVDETFTIGVYPDVPDQIAAELKDEGVILVNAPSKEALLADIDNGTFEVGAVFSNDFAQQITSGYKGDITLYFGPEIPTEVHEFYVLFFQELGFGLTGQELNIDANEEVLGVDLVGQQIPFRDRMLPLLALLLFMTETLGMSTLISAEFESGAATALLITPMNAREFFAGKGVTGVLLAFSQAFILMLAVGGLRTQPAIVVLTLLLAAIMVTGIGFLIGSAAKDMLSSIAWGVPMIVILSIPAFGVMFPGSVSSWVKLIPSYYVVETIHLVSNLGGAWSDVAQNLLILAGADILILILGLAALKRKLA